MTSYKKVAAELETRVDDLAAENARLMERIEFLQSGIIDEMGGALSNDDAKEVLAKFADRARTKEELLLLIRTLTRV